MKEYKNILKLIKSTGYRIPAARENMPDTIFLNSMRIPLDFMNGFPILTGKKMPFYSIVAELVGFMKGITDVRKFDKLGTKVWWDNAYKWNIVDKNLPITIEEYKLGNAIPDDTTFPIGNMHYNLGRIYSAQWRNWISPGKEVDQLVSIIDNINKNPYSRYHVMTTWNPAEMNSSYVSQPNCHVYFQASCTPYDYNEQGLTNLLNTFLTKNTIDELINNGYRPNKFLYTHLTQRSCDMFLGVPFNLTSYALFTILLAIFTNSIPVEFIWNGVNSHIYSDHIEAVDEYLKSNLYDLPKLNITGIKSLDDIEKLETLKDIKEHFSLENYNYDKVIKANLSVGL